MSTSFVRGFVLSGVVLFAPFAAALGIFYLATAAHWNDVTNLAFTAAVWCWWLVIPYWSIRPIFVTSGVGLLIAAVQWLVVASAVGLLTRHSTVWITIAIAIGAVAGVGVAVPLMLWLFGYQLVFEGP